MRQQNNFADLRENMVQSQIEARGITDKRVLSAFRKIKRHYFVLEEYLKFAYDDYPLPIGQGQTISQPYMAALMTAYLKPNESDRVLEIGTGSGYQSAILAELCKEVYTVERIEPLLLSAKGRLDKLGYTNIEFKIDDGTLGWKEQAPFDRIIVTCGSPSSPGPLKEQLADKGRLLIPVGDRFIQTLTLIQRDGNKFNETSLCGCMFVPLIGKYGWT
ncbi:MAG: protein-L-isoaspartate(D-aspartate) O-methyltransferase [Candidatus Omnitrophota bacterium]